MWDVWEYSNAPEYKPRGGMVAIHAGLTESQADAKVAAIHQGKRYFYPRWAQKRKAA